MDGRDVQREDALRAFDPAMTALCGIEATARDALQPLLPGGRRALALPVRLPLLLALFMGAVAAVEAAGGCPEHAMVPGVMAGDAADRGAL